MSGSERGAVMNALALLLVFNFVSAALCAPALAAPVAISLKESVEAMLRHNHSLKSIQENRDAAAHDVIRAKAGHGPRVDVTASGGVGRLSDSTTRYYDYDGVSTYSSASLLVTQPLWDSRLTRGRVREAEATRRSLDHRVLDNANTLALDAIIAHVDVLRRERIHRLAQDNVANHERFLAKARAREALGVDTATDVSQAQSRLARARSALTEAQAALLTAEDTYAWLTRLPALNLAEAGAPAVMYENREALLDATHRGNPKVAAYKEDVRAATAVLEQARSAYGASVTIDAGPTCSGRGGKRTLWREAVGAAAVARWNLFNSGADVAGSKAAAARIRQSRHVLYDYLDTLKLNVESTWTQYLSAQKQFDFYTEAVSHNRKTRAGYEEQFVMGQRGLLDVLDAESELFNSSTQAATARANVLITVYTMKALAGDLLPSLGVDTEKLKFSPADNESSRSASR